MVPKGTKFVTYYRVSTAQQGRSGLGLDAQKASVQSFLAANAGIEIASFTEIESGKINDRPKLKEAIERSKLMRATLLVAKLDRLSRNAAFLLTLRDTGVRFACCDLPDLTTFSVGLMAVIAQHERETISQRTIAALKAAKARGTKLGNPIGVAAFKSHQALGRKRATETILAKAKMNAIQILAVVEEAKSKGFTTLQGIADYLNDMGVPTPNGSVWYATSVRNALKHIAA